MSTGIARKQGKKNRKWKRNILKCARYRNEERQEKNKARKLRRHLRSHGNDRQAVHAFANLSKYH